MPPQPSPVGSIQASPGAVLQSPGQVPVPPLTQTQPIYPPPPGTPQPQAPYQAGYGTPHRAHKRWSCLPVLLLIAIILGGYAFIVNYSCYQERQAESLASMKSHIEDQVSSEFYEPAYGDSPSVRCRSVELIREDRHHYRGVAYLSDGRSYPIDVFVDGDELTWRVDRLGTAGR